MRSIAPRSAVGIAVVAAAATTLAQPAAVFSQPAAPADPPPAAGAAQPAPPAGGVAPPAGGVAEPAPAGAPSAGGVAQPAPADAPSVPPSGAQPAREDLLRAGAEALEAGRLGQALALYERALGPARVDPRTWFNLCLVRYSAGDYGRAFNACYRALPADPVRVIALLDEIAAAMRAANVRTGRLIVPEPEQRWYTPEKGLSESLTASEEPPAAAGAVRAFEPAPLAEASAADVVAAARLDYLRGPKPRLPYHVQSRPEDYGVGLDVSPRGGLLFYAPDTTPVVGGGRLEWRRREPGTSSSYDFYFAEYLHAIDKTGGIGAIGLGGRGGKFSGSIGLSVPWGRHEGRRHVLIPDHTLALHGELRFGMYRDVMIDRSWALSFEGSLVAGLNLAKAAIRLGDKLSDACGSEETDCPMTPDANPHWPLGHFMIQLGFSFGFRGRHPKYDRAHVFAPMGGS
ncbi:MAG TPA: tetratricopeptide repeat protein [Kofleriaceae bacterium]|nr:tetratricopeptide repeat protein [Kofleriaceae bacterium]